MSTLPESTQVPTYPQYTNLALNDGLFDQLMQSVAFHLDKEYNQQRIRGTDYAKVYIQAINGVMQNTTQYLLGTLLFKDQQEKMAAEISLTETQEKKIEVDIELVELQKLQLKYEIENILPLQATKLQAEIDLIDANELKVDAEVVHMTAQQALWTKQGLKIDKEIEFLTAKIVTENANTQAGIANADSLIGRQMTLLKAQRFGFAGDLQVKSAKLHADYDAVFQSVQEVPADVLLHGPATTLISSAASTASSILSGGFS